VFNIGEVKENFVASHDFEVDVIVFGESKLGFFGSVDELGFKRNDDGENNSRILQIGDLHLDNSLIPRIPQKFLDSINSAGLSSGFEKHGNSGQRESGIRSRMTLGEILREVTKHNVHCSRLVLGYE